MRRCSTILCISKMVSIKIAANLTVRQLEEDGEWWKVQRCSEMQLTRAFRSKPSLTDTLQIKEHHLGVI
jgi:hypothetical protein